jgi:hypothetical protein
MLAIREFKNVPISMSVLYELEYQKIQEEMAHMAQQIQERERQRRSSSESNSRRVHSDTPLKKRQSYRMPQTQVGGL